MFRESTQIIKQHGKACFVDVRADFCLGEGKVSFNFRSLDQNNKVNGIIDCYLNIEEFQLIAHMFKTGSIFSYLKTKGRYVSYGGKKGPNGEIISRQLRIEGDENGLYIKALQGPGKKTPQGGYAPSYKDNEAMTILVKVDPFQAQMMGFAFQRAIDYYDEWNRSGILDERMKALNEKWRKENNVGTASMQSTSAPAVSQPATTWYQQTPQGYMPPYNQIPSSPEAYL